MRKYSKKDNNNNRHYQSCKGNRDKGVFCLLSLGRKAHAGLPSEWLCTRALQDAHGTGSGGRAGHSRGRGGAAAADDAPGSSKAEREKARRERLNERCKLGLGDS